MNSMKKAFTYIELIIVIGILGMILPALFTIVFSVMQQQVKVMHLTEVKRQGDYLLSIMQNTIRNNAVSLHTDVPSSSPDNEVCRGESTETAFTHFRDKTDTSQWFTYGIDAEDKLASDSSVLTAPAALTTGRVVVSDLSISCTKTNQFSNPIVNVEFVVSYDTASTRAEDIASLTYSTNIKLRNAE
jgi:type II secretory pathway pseudopilin PulG